MDRIVAICEKHNKYMLVLISHARIQLQANVGAALVGEDEATADAAAKEDSGSAALALL